MHLNFSQAKKMHQATCKAFTAGQTIAAARCVDRSIIKRKIEMQPMREQYVNYDTNTRNSVTINCLNVFIFASDGLVIDKTTK
jgi:hypothetical protein